MKLNRKDILLYTILGAFCLYLFWDIIIHGHWLFGSDFVKIHLIMKKFLYDEIHRFHSIPLWNPYIFAGIPFLAHFESTIFYPLDFLFWIIPPHWAYGYTMFIHLLLAAFFMYILARSLQFSSFGSFLTASIFTFNCFVMATLYSGQMVRIQAFIWIPLIIFFLRKACILKKPYLNASLAGFFWGIQILSGSPQDAFYTFIAACLFLIFNVKFNSRETYYNLRIFTTVCLLLFIGLGIAAIQLIPSIEFINQSVRSGFGSYNQITLGSYPLKGIITTLLPHFYGNYTKGDFWISGVPWSIPPYNLYVGVLPFVLILFLSRRSSRDGRILAFIFCCLIFAFILALGSNTPLYKLIHHIPGFDKIRAPSKIIVLWVFAFALLGGKGIDSLFTLDRASLLYRSYALCFLIILLLIMTVLFSWERSFVMKTFSPFILNHVIPNKFNEASNLILKEFHRFILIILFITLVILFWIRGFLTYRFAAALLCIFLLIDLGYANRGAVPHNDKVYHWLMKTKKVLNDSVGKDNSLYRVGSYAYVLGANIDMYYGYQSINGYGPLFSKRYYDYINKYKYYKRTIPEGWIIFFYGDYANSQLMDLLNVKYVISYADRNYAFRKTHLPRAFIVPNCKAMGKEKILDYMVASDFDPSKTVLFELDESESCHKHPALNNNLSSTRVKFISYRPNHIIVETNSSEPGYLFLSEIFYPGWKAFLDDCPKRILRGNYLFRVVEIPKGRHMVKYTFDPISVKIGIGLSIFTLLIFLVFLSFGYFRRIFFPK